MNQPTININGVDITSDNPQWFTAFTAIDGYLMTEEIAQRYRHKAPMRALRAIDVLPTALLSSFTYQFLEQIIRLDHWSYWWIRCYLMQHKPNISSRERDMLFGRLISQYYRMRDEGKL